MLYTGPWGSVHFFPLCCLYWIISINLSLSSPTLLCHCCWAHNDVLINALPSLPHEGQRVEQWTWISIVTWKAICRYFGTWLLLLFANKKHPCQNDCGEEWKLNILQLIKRARTCTHTHTHTHTHAELMGCHISEPTLWAGCLLQVAAWADTRHKLPRCLLSYSSQSIQVAAIIPVRRMGRWVYPNHLCLQTICQKLSSFFPLRDFFQR